MSEALRQRKVQARKTVSKRELDVELAILLDLTPKKVGEITSCFLGIMADHLAEMHNLSLPGFGQFHVTLHEMRGTKLFKNGAWKVRVNFSKSELLRDAHRRKTKEIPHGKVRSR